MEWIQALITIISLIVAALAWIAKIRWSKEFAMAKNEIIKAKEEQMKTLEREISSLREMTPMKLREYFLSVKQQLEGYNTVLQARLRDVETELEEKNVRIAALEQRSIASAATVGPSFNEIAEFKQIVIDQSRTTKVRGKELLELVQRFADVVSGVTYTMSAF